MDSATKCAFTMLLVSLAGSGCASADNPVLESRQVFVDGRLLDSKNVILNTSHPADVQLCQGFSLDENKIKEFFKKADQVSSETVHSLYQVSPCEIQGHFIYRGKKYWFDVNAASTGVIEVSDKNFVYFGCKDKCKDIIDYGY
jgi:hypothetical protein